MVQTDTELILKDPNLTTDEALSILIQDYYPMVQNGRNIKLFSTMVTPEMAKFLLSKNKSNRKISAQNLRILTFQVENKMWLEVSDSILVSEDDVLINGQHRLSVIAKLGIPLSLRIETNVDKRVFSVIDIGKKRTGADTLAVELAKWPKPTANAVRFIALLSTNTIRAKAIAFSNPEYSAFYKAHPRLQESMEYGKTLKNSIFSHSLLAAFHYLLSETTYKTLAEEFLTKIALGCNIEPNCATGVLREKMSHMNKTRESSEDKLEYCIIAWNKYVVGEKIKVLKKSTEEAKLIM